MKFYLAYGSNLNKRQMARRCPDAEPFGTVYIPDYALTFRGNFRGMGVANIEPCKGSIVQAGLWKISAADEESLDIYEGYPHLYDKKDMDVVCDGQVVRAMVYIIRMGLKYAKPSEDYLGIIEQGYKDFGFDTEPLIGQAVGASLLSSTAQGKRATSTGSSARQEMRFASSVASRTTTTCGSGSRNPEAMSRRSRSSGNTSTS